MGYRENSSGKIAKKDAETFTEINITGILNYEIREKEQGERERANVIDIYHSYGSVMFGGP